MVADKDVGQNNSPILLEVKSPRENTFQLGMFWGN